MPFNGNLFIATRIISHLYILKFILWKIQKIQNSKNSKFSNNKGVFENSLIIINYFYFKIFQNSKNMLERENIAALPSAQDV